MDTPRALSRGKMRLDRAHTGSEGATQTLNLIPKPSWGSQALIIFKPFPFYPERLRGLVGGFQAFRRPKPCNP